MNRILKNLWEIFGETFNELSKDKVPKLSASLAYYIIFSLAPMLLVVISLVEIFLGREVIQGEIYEHLSSFLLMISLVINAVLMVFNERLNQFFPDFTVHIVHGIKFLITFAVISFLFAIIFKVLPDAKIRWRNVIIGSSATALLFPIEEFAISFYLGKSTISSTYG